MIPKSKFKVDEIVYFKYPSRYAPTSSAHTVEAILQIIHVSQKPDAAPYLARGYIVRILKSIRGDFMKTSVWVSGGSGEWSCEGGKIDTYCRPLTPTEKVLYG